MDFFVRPAGWIPSIGVIVFLWCAFPGFWFWLGLIACALLILAAVQ